jgi:trehalose 6-phosphate synthase
VVSNRTADAKQSGSGGGLAVGVLGTLERGGGLWFGWNGQLTPGDPGAPRVRTRRGISYATFDLNERQFEQYYNGFCNNTLWPLFHYRLGFFEYDRAQYMAYLDVNSHFARGLCPLLAPGDLVWVHDFHVIPLGAMLRASGVDAPLGFFLHTPFPSFEVLRALPVWPDLVTALCAYDVVGFQTARDLTAFLEAVTRSEVGGEVSQDRVHYRGRTFRAGVFPIGIDVPACAELARADQGSRRLDAIKTSLSGRRLLIGVDRLDYSKGLPRRFHAYERLLDLHPTNRREVVFMQIAPPTRVGVRAYTDIRQELEQAAGHINGKFADVDWAPLRYLNRSLDRQSLMALFRLARIGLVTPIRDGMNLVAKEYVAAQDPADPGVLVLSTMAGSAEELKDAILVNPYDADAVAEGIHRGLTMPLAERRQRHEAMMDVLARNDIGAWRSGFVAALSGAPSARAS